MSHYPKNGLPLFNTLLFPLGALNAPESYISASRVLAATSVAETRPSVGNRKASPPRLIQLANKRMFQAAGGPHGNPAVDACQSRIRKAGRPAQGGNRGEGLLPCYYPFELRRQQPLESSGSAFFLEFVVDDFCKAGRTEGARLRFFRTCRRLDLLE